MQPRRPLDCTEGDLSRWWGLFAQIEALRGQDQEYAEAEKASLHPAPLHTLSCAPLPMSLATILAPSHRQRLSRVHVPERRGGAAG